VAAEGGIKKGAKTKLLGVVLICLGGLDSLLSWRGGFAPSNFYALLITAGVVLFILGAIRSQSGHRIEN
jgi:hypothetical protein